MRQLCVPDADHPHAQFPRFLVARKCWPHNMIEHRGSMREERNEPCGAMPSASQGPELRTRILSFTTVFPNPASPQAGLFVANRLQRVGELEKLTVVAPVTRWDFRRWRRASPAIPLRRREGAIEVFHPRWTCAPAGGALNGFLLFLQTLPCVWRIGRRNFDIIDVHFGHPEAFAAALLAIAVRRPFVVTLRGSEVIHGRYPLRRCLWAGRCGARRG